MLRITDLNINSGSIIECKCGCRVSQLSKLNYVSCNEVECNFADGSYGNRVYSEQVRLPPQTGETYQFDKNLLKYM